MFIAVDPPRRWDIHIKADLGAKKSRPPYGFDICLLLQLQ